MTVTTPSSIPMRERLRIDYQWTPRQRQVLELMARGKTNSEIGEILGISLDGAKWHVSEILSKLQAESREEAAEYWRRYNGLAPRFERVFRGIFGGVALRWAAGAAAVVVAGAAAGAVVGIWLNQSSEEPASSGPNPIVTPGLTDPPSAPGSPGIPGGSRTLSINQPLAGIPNSAMYIVTGCTQCDGPDETLQKHVTDANGATTVTTLLGSNTGVLDGWTIGEIAGAPDASLLAAVVCDQEYCGSMGSGEFREQFNAEWRVVVSDDGGQTWSVAYTYTGDYLHLSQVVPNGFAAMPSNDATGQLAREFIAYYGGQVRELTPPAAAGATPWHFILADGTILWTNDEFDRLFREDGAEIRLTAPARATRLAHQPLSQLPDGTLAIAWASTTSDGYYSEILQLLDANGNVTATLDGNANYLLRVAGDGVAIGNISGDKAGGTDGAPVSYPAVIDLNDGSATPIVSDVLTEQMGRNRFIAFEQL